MYGPRRPGALWGEREFRGSSGSAKREGESGKPQVTLSADRHGVPGGTTRSMRPGPIRPGEWAVQLPVAAVVKQSEGDLDGKVAFRVEIDLIQDPSFADQPYRAATYRTAPARRKRDWYLGDFHVHGNHSEGGATMKEAFDFGFRSARRRRRRPGLPLAHRPQHRQRLGRDRRLPGRLPGQADHPRRRGHHLPRPHDESRQRALRGPPHGGGVHRGDRRRRPHGRPHPAPPGARRVGDPARGQARRRLQPDQPPHDLPQRGAGLRQPLPRLLVELPAGADRLLERRRDRGGHRARRHRRPGPEPVHRHGDRLLGAAARRRASGSRRSG